MAHLLVPSFPKAIFRPQTPNVTALGSKSFFMSNFIKFCMKQVLIFKFWVNFDKVMSVYSQKIEKIHQKSSFWCQSRYVSSLKVLHKKIHFFEH